MPPPIAPSAAPWNPPKTTPLAYCLNSAHGPSDSLTFTAPAVAPPTKPPIIPPITGDAFGAKKPTAPPATPPATAPAMPDQRPAEGLPPAIPEVKPADAPSTTPITAPGIPTSPVGSIRLIGLFWTFIRSRLSAKQSASPYISKIYTDLVQPIIRHNFDKKSKNRNHKADHGFGFDTPSPCIVHETDNQMIFSG